MIQKLEKSGNRSDLVKKSTRNLSRMLAGAGDEDKFVKCSDDITGKELPWQAVKQAREQEVEVSARTWRA